VAGGAAWSPADYGEAWAEVYDEVHAGLAADTAAAVPALLSQVPPGGLVVDLGVGTGRLAIPLADAGRRVVGLDASARMLAALRAKPGGRAVLAVRGDLAAPPLAGPADLVLLAFNTLFALPSADAQARCLAAAARLLAPGGRLVGDAAVPRPDRIGAGSPAVGDVTDQQVVLSVADHDPAAQVVRAAHVLVHDRLGVRTLPVALRYAGPEELDAMAAAAGLQLRRRAAGWAGEAYGPAAARHISAYARRV
jgi:SAM-dependent methyltransferase